MKIDLSKQELANVVDALRYWMWEPGDDDSETINPRLSDQHQSITDADMLILITRLTEMHNHDLP